MSTNRTNPQSGRARKRDLQTGANGRFLCRYCSIEVSPPRRTFCSDACVHEWKLRSSTTYLRRAVFRRDKGICCDCWRDCGALDREIRRLRRARDRAGLEAMWAHLVPLGFDKGRSAWNVEHQLAVVEGGGECGLENVVSCCVPCHRVRTKALRARLRKS